MQELLSRLGGAYCNEARAACRLFAGKHTFETVTGDKVVTCAYHAQRTSTVPADPNPGTPSTGAGSVTDSRALLTNEEQVEFMSSLHPRELAIMALGAIQDVAFDTMRTASRLLRIPRSLPYGSLGFGTFMV